MPSERPVTLLHLSDFKLGRAPGALESAGLLDTLRCELDQRRDTDGLSPDILVLSGNLSAHGRRDELDSALEMVRGLLRIVDLPARRAVVVPGNHDINWNKSIAYFAECAAEENAPARPYFPKLSFYKQLVDRLYEGEPDLSFTEAEPWTFFAYPELGVVVAGLDAVLAESHRDEDHHPHLGERQMRAFVERLRPYKEQGFLRLGVMHHDPAAPPVPGADQDAADFARILRPWLNLVLHGDTRAPRLGWLSAEVPSFGVGPATAPPGEHQWIQVRRGGVRWARPAAARTPERIEIVERYRRAVARDQGMPTVFDLLGVNESGERAAGLDFLRVFVPQYATIEEPRRPRRDERYEELASKTTPELPEAVPAPSERMLDRTETVDTLLAGRRLFLIGAPGAGKTALTRWLLLKLCVPGEGLPGFGDDQVPVRVEMRRFDEGERSAERGGRSYDFFDHLDVEHGERGWPLRGKNLRALAREGRIYWLFDGLDEVIDEERRRRHAEQIGALFEAYPKCQGLATSRSAGADIARPSLEGARFATYALQSFVDPQRDRFLDAWHALVFARDPHVGRHRRARMAQAIEAAPSLRELCQSPLLCALLAYLNREEELPHRRHRLYQKILERMAEHWDANKGLPKLPGAERLEIDSKLLFLRRLAWHMLATPERKAGNAIEQSELEAFTERFCEDRWELGPEAARGAAEALIRHLRERNAVLAFFGGTTYGFAHRTFFEYLAAVEAHERFRDRLWELGDLEKVFAQHWEDPAWEEPLLLICGLLAEGNPDHVVRVLQGIVAEDRAIVYGALDEHLAFCIKGLGELPRLDKGIPLEFARAINDILEFQIHDPMPLPSHILQGAFRRCAGRWPQLERLLAATREGIAAGHGWLTNLYECWVSAGGRELRTVVLAAGLPYPFAPIYSLAKEAASFGPWSPGEIDEICALARKQSQHGKFSLLNALMGTAGMVWKDDDEPIQMLVAMVRRGGYLEAAYELARAGYHRAEMLAFLGSELRIEGESSRAPNAVWWMSKLGYGTDVVDLLEKHAAEGPGFVTELADLSRRSDAAQAALRRVQERVRKDPDHQIFFATLIAAARRGVMLASEDEILERLRAIDRKDVRHAQTHVLLYEPSLLRVGIRAVDIFFSESTDSQYQTLWADDASTIDRRRGGDGLIALWLKILGSPVSSISIVMAGHIWRTADDGALRERARRHLLGYLGEGHGDGTRLLAARNLGVRDAAGYECHRVLARTANSESIRFGAARFVGDRESLNALAERAQNPHWREQAQVALDLYGHLDFLSKVGRPRHARVRFHGRDVGTLEETISLGGATRFTYFAAYLAIPGARPIAPNLRLRPEPYECDTLHPFFANLLPEGALYTRTARRLGLKRSDRFGMLLHVGADVMGAVEVLPAEPS